MAEVKLGLRLLSSPSASQYDRDTLILAVFNYYMEQSHAVRWRRLFYVDSSADPERGYERAHKYVGDRMTNPPPLVVRLVDGFAVVEREARAGEGVRRCTRRATAAQALEDWCRAVVTRRACTVAVGKTAENLFRQIADERTQEQPLAVRLRAVFAHRRADVSATPT